MNIKEIKNQIKKGKKIKLNFGSGLIKKKGYLNVDINKNEHVDIVCDLTIINSIFEEGSVDEIYSRHVIEHFPRNETKKILKNWVDLLRRGGKMILDFPDLDRYIDFYSSNKEKIKIEEFARWLYGNQSDEYDYHKAGFNGEYISTILIDCGMKILSIEESLVGNGLPPENKSMIGTKIIAIKK